jgi:hypothetical protein
MSGTGLRLRERSRRVPFNHEMKKGRGFPRQFAKFGSWRCEPRDAVRSVAYKDMALCGFVKATLKLYCELANPR